LATIVAAIKAQQVAAKMMSLPVTADSSASIVVMLVVS
jgi:hypothetical protein